MTVDVQIQVSLQLAQNIQLLQLIFESVQWTKAQANFNISIWPYGFKTFLF